ncbi:MAG: hypothetical protein EOO69_04435 [Moraxellaceae bacterium]|nr:MAG: hypothetical protein EOO69_04435 [Moraxellaceae bacterium]
MDCLSDFAEIDGLEVFTTGDTFDMPIQFYNTETNEPFEIPEDATFTAQLNNEYGNSIATLSAARVADQVGFKGFINVTFPGSTTSWPAGTARTDIRMYASSATHTSDPIVFKIRRSQTP